MRATRTLLLALSALLAGCIGNPARNSEPVAQIVVPAPPVAAVPTNPGAIYQPSTGVDLFADLRARRAGDILTVVLVEKTDATKSAGTSTSRGTDITIGVPSLLGSAVTLGGRDLMSTTLDANTGFVGQGESSQSNSLTGSIAVIVQQVLANGNLVIAGEKVITLNQGEEFIRISGIVRAVDIRPDNTVPSTLLANARISYSGKGALQNANRMAWLSRLFNSKIWPL